MVLDRQAALAGLIAVETARAQAQAPTVTEGTQLMEAGSDANLQHGQVHRVNPHNATQFGRDKAALFGDMLRHVSVNQPLADVLVITTSGGSPRL